MSCSVIFAMDKNGVIGNGTELPWKDDESTKWDMKHFKETTTGNIVIMGYNTAKGMKPLKNRINIVSARPSTDTISVYGIPLAANPDSCFFYASEDPETLVNALNELWPDKKVYCIGGAKLIDKFMKAGVVDEVIVTEFNKEYTGDIKFDKNLLKGWVGQYLLVPTDVNGSICKYKKA